MAGKEGSGLFQAANRIVDALQFHHYRYTRAAKQKLKVFFIVGSSRDIQKRNDLPPSYRSDPPGPENN
jgi:hypothetical protein